MVRLHFIMTTSVPAVLHWKCSVDSQWKHIFSRPTLDRESGKPSCLCAVISIIEECNHINRSFLAARNLTCHSRRSPAGTNPINDGSAPFTRPSKTWWWASMGPWTEHPNGIQPWLMLLGAPVFDRLSTVRKARKRQARSDQFSPWQPPGLQTL